MLGSGGFFNDHPGEFAFVTRHERRVSASGFQASVVFLACFVQIAFLSYFMNGGKDHFGMISWLHRYSNYFAEGVRLLAECRLSFTTSANESEMTQ